MRTWPVTPAVSVKSAHDAGSTNDSRVPGPRRGVTLIELVVVCSVMTVILGFVTRTLVVMQNASTGSSLRLQNLDEARVLMDLVSKDIRTAGRMTPTTSPFDVTACTANGQMQPCAPAGWTPGGNPAPYVGKSELWFYANITLANQTQASPCPDIVHLFVDSTVNPPVLQGADDLRRQPHDRRPTELQVRGSDRPVHGHVDDAARGQVHRERHGELHHARPGRSSTGTTTASGTPTAYPTPRGVAHLGRARCR